MMIALRDPLADGGDKLYEDARAGSVPTPPIGPCELAQLRGLVCPSHLAKGAIERA